MNNTKIKKRKPITDIKTISFEITGKKLGNSCYVLIPKSFLGKRLKISIELIEE